MVALAVTLWKRVPTGFIPTEDKGYFAIAMQLPDASSLQRTKAVIQRVEGFLHQEHAVVNVVAFAGLDVLTRTNQTNSATIFILLKPWEDRGKDETIDAITKRINGKLFGMKDAVGFAFNLPEIPGLGSTSGVEVNLQNRRARMSGILRRTCRPLPPRSTGCPRSRPWRPISGPTCPRSIWTWTGSRPSRAG